MKDKEVIKSKAKKNEMTITGYNQANLVFVFNNNMKLQFCKDLIPNYQNEK